MPSDLELNVDYIESLYQDFQRDPASVPVDWREYFALMPADGNGNGNGNGNGHGSAVSASVAPPPHLAADTGQPAEQAPLTITRGGLSTAEFAALQQSVDMLVRNYRVRGHIIAKVNPLGFEPPSVFELDPACWGIKEEDLDRAIAANRMPGPDVQTVRQIIERMRNTYCRSIGVQFMHIDSLIVRRWLDERMETTENRTTLTREEQLRILQRLTEAVLFEQFIQKKYTGAKSFSLEGAETLIPLLEMAIEKAGQQGVKEIVLGMAHRGRLNVLANIMGKRPEQIFREFDDKAKGHGGAGDVKYHMGHSADLTLPDGNRMHLTLCFNPSHLEYINPVAMGRLRAKMDRANDVEHNKGLAILIHGDAAFIGEGITQETLNLSELPAYRVGGALHIIVNNQIGFTTQHEQSRSTHYCTDVAKMLQAPIFHVNGEDPEAVAQVIRLAMDFRARFQRDVFIDMYCYRRRGHNEGDEPQFTQPKLYQAIEKRKSVGESYEEHLLALGGVTKAEADAIREKHTARLEEALKMARKEPAPPREPYKGVWAGYHGGSQYAAKEPVTAIDLATVKQLLQRTTALPSGFTPHPKIKRLLEARVEMAQGKKPLDWAAGEAMAFASLAVQGHRVRMSGQDAERGTFSHRHSVLHDVEDGGTWCPLKHLSPDQAPIEIYNSALSEAGVLGFEYGYSLDRPDGLCVWEAQFGDFFNCAQVIVDQFIASAEDKWDRLSGITLFLPHGYEGQGPEHSSARIERWLAQGAKDNIQVCQPSTPAQQFHLLRRQVLSNLRKPLIVFTPKSLLRHPDVISSLDDFAVGRFQRVIPDAKFAVAGKPADAGAPKTAATPAKTTKKVERVLMCSGRVYYDLMKRRDDLKREDVAIVRMEQLYPLPLKEMEEAMSVYADNTPVFWVQDEPRNMGAWPFLRANLGFIIFGRLPFMGFHRDESASPAVGSPSVHKAELEELLRKAFEETVGYE